MSAYSLVVVAFISSILGSNLLLVSSWSLRQLFEEYENGSFRLTTDDYGSLYHSNTPSRADFVNNDGDNQPTTAYVIGGLESTNVNAANACGRPSSPFAVGGDSGWIASPNYPREYQNYEQCQWLITSASANGVVSLSFHYLRTESCCDYVAVYDGNSSEAPLLARLSGSYEAVTYTSTQPNMLVIFSADSSVTYNGFNASYWSPVDNPGAETSYTISVKTDNDVSELSATDFNVHIILEGISGTTLKLPLDIRDETRNGTFGFANVQSVGILKCVDFIVSGSRQDLSLFVDTVSIEEGSGHPTMFELYRSYRVDSERWPVTHGCGKKYRISTLTNYEYGAESGARIYITLIGENGYSPELLLRNRYDEFFSRGDYDQFEFKGLPELGNISCVNLRRDDRGQDPSWRVASVDIYNFAGNYHIDINRWVPSIANVPRGIVVCNNDSTLCLSDLEATCPLPSQLTQSKISSGRELIQKLIDVDLLDVCPQVQDYTECASAFLQINDKCSVEQRVSEDVRVMLRLMSVVVNQLCGGYLAAFSCHRDCLLQVADDGELKLSKNVRHACAEYLTSDADTEFEFPPLCQSHEFINCVKKVVSRQCTDDVAEIVAKFYGDVSTKLCDPSTKPNCPYDFTMSDAGCYKVVSERRDWYSASQKCNGYGPNGHLVFINKENEQQHVNNLLRKYAGSVCNTNAEVSNVVTSWTGGLRQENQQIFKWHYNYTSAAGLICSKDWNNGPQDAYNYYSSCIKVNTYGETNYQWQSTGCSDGYCFVCEIDL